MHSFKITLSVIIAGFVIGIAGFTNSAQAGGRHHGHHYKHYGHKYHGYHHGYRRGYHHRRHGYDSSYYIYNLAIPLITSAIINSQYRRSRDYYDPNVRYYRVFCEDRYYGHIRKRHCYKVYDQPRY